MLGNKHSLHFSFTLHFHHGFPGGSAPPHLETPGNRAAHARVKDVQRTLFHVCEHTQDDSPLKN